MFINYKHTVPLEICSNTVGCLRVAITRHKANQSRGTHVRRGCLRDGGHLVLPLGRAAAEVSNHQLLETILEPVLVYNTSP